MCRQEILPPLLNQVDYIEGVLFLRGGQEDEVGGKFCVPQKLIPTPMVCRGLVGLPSVGVALLEKPFVSQLSTRLFMIDACTLYLQKKRVGVEHYSSAYTWHTSIIGAHTHHKSFVVLSITDLSSNLLRRKSTSAQSPYPILSIII